MPKLLIALALASSIGLHWFFLQSVAWTSMLVSNLGTASFSQAVTRTFDGKHPCSLCRAIAEGRKSEKKSETVLPLKKFEGMNQTVTRLIFPPARFPSVEESNANIETLPHTPPSPPPRAA